MSNNFYSEKAFKSKAKCLGAFLHVPTHAALDLLSKILGYGDYHAARCAELAIPELTSRAELSDRIGRIVPNITAEQVDELAVRLRLRTVDDVVAAHDGERNLPAELSQYLAVETGALTEHYQASLREVRPAFLRIHGLSLSIAEWHQPAASIGTIVKGMVILTEEDANAAIGILEPVFRKTPSLLPVSTAMLVLHSVVRRRTVQVFLRNALRVLKGMLDLTGNTEEELDDNETHQQLEHYGLLIAAVQRSIGAHEACLDVLQRLVALHRRSRRGKTFAAEHFLLSREVAFSALFARRFHDALQAHSVCVANWPNGIPTPALMAIGAIAKAQLGDRKGATQLIDFLLCDNRTRAALGLDEARPVARRRSVAMPINIHVMEILGGDRLEKLRYVDLKAFDDAHTLFMQRDILLRRTLHTSELVFKGVQFFPELRYREKQAKKKSFNQELVTPFVLRFGPAPGAKTGAEIGVLCLKLHGSLGQDRWAAPSELDDIFAGNAFFRLDPMKVRWLKHILSSENMKTLQKYPHGQLTDVEIQLGTGQTMPGPQLRNIPASLDLRDQNEDSPGWASGDAGLGIDWSSDELCIELFLRCEPGLKVPANARSMHYTFPEKMISQAIEAFRSELVEYLVPPPVTENYSLVA